MRDGESVDERPESRLIKNNGTDVRTSEASLDKRD